MLCYSGAMPTYCYSAEKNGRLILAAERIFPMGEAPPSIIVNGLEAKRDYRAERVAVPPTAGWPMEPCFASGVHPNQAQELCNYLEERGVPTEVNNEGDPIYRSATHRRKVLAARGMHDRSSFN